MCAQFRLYHRRPLGPSVTLICLLCVSLAACVHGPSSGSSPRQAAALSSAESPPFTARFATMDAAAAAAAAEIERLNAHQTRKIFPVEWSFNIFRDAEGYFPGSFHTDYEFFSVGVRIRTTALASGHNHAPRNARSELCTMCGGESTDGESLSKWDLGSQGVLRTLERAGRHLPHYLVTPSGRLRVWEWQGRDKRWVAREVRRPDPLSGYAADMVR